MKILIRVFHRNLRDDMKMIRDEFVQKCELMGGTDASIGKRNKILV